MVACQRAHEPWSWSLSFVGERRPHVPAHYGQLEWAIRWLMVTMFESENPAEKTRLAATEMRARLVLERYWMRRVMWQARRACLPTPCARHVLACHRVQGIIYGRHRQRSTVVDKELDRRGPLIGERERAARSLLVSSRFVITSSCDSVYHCEVGAISGLAEAGCSTPRSVFEFSRRTVENTDDFDVVLLVPPDQARSRFMRERIKSFPPPVDVRLALYPLRSCTRFEPADVDRCGTIDLFDFESFFRAFTGPERRVVHMRPE